MDFKGKMRGIKGKIPKNTLKRLPARRMIILRRDKYRRTPLKIVRFIKLEKNDFLEGGK